MAFLLTAPGALAQQPLIPQYLHEAWTVDDGLPVNSITDLIQSQDGYLWLATFDGLVRFDGARFTVYNTSTHPDLPSNRFTRLKEAEDGSLLLMSEQHDLLRFKEGQFDLLAKDAIDFFEGPEPTGDPVPPIIAELGNGLYQYAEGSLLEIMAFPPDWVPVELGKFRYRDQSGALWFGSDTARLRRFHQGTLATYTTADGLADNDVVSITEDDQGGLWIGTRAGINYFRDGQLSRLLVDGKPWQGDAVRLHLDPSGTLWIGDGATKSLYKWREGTLEMVHDQLRDMRMLGRRAQSQDWLAMGLWLFLNDRLFTRFDVALSMIRSDREGNLWVGTQGQGLHRYKRSLFTVYGTPEGLTEDNIYPILEDDEGALWFGTWSGGLNRLWKGQIIAYTFTAIPHPTGNFSEYISTLFQDHTGSLWIGGMNGDALLRREGKAFIPVPVGPSLGIPRAIYEDRQHRLWVGHGDTGLHQYHEGTWTYYDEDDGFPYEGVRIVAETPDGTLWFGTNGDGVVRYQAGRFEQLSKTQGFPSDNIRALYPDPDDENLLWVGSEDQGLFRLHLQPGIAIEDIGVTVYQTDDGLYYNGIHQILEDDAGRLWMNTNQGIFWVEKRELNAYAAGAAARIHSVAYTERDGLRNREGNGGSQPAGIKASDGRLWFPTQAGAVVVDPRDVSVEPPSVLVEQVLAGNQAYRIDGGTVSLPADQRDFEIEYTAPTFTNPERVRFRYLLAGYDQAWKEETRRSAIYTNIAPGTYTFRVAASYNDQWPDEEAAFQLVIAPYFYETTWFYALCILALLGLVGGGYRLRINRMKTREAKLTALVQSRTRELRQEKEKTERALDQLAEQAEQLKELDAAKSRFYANVSHEFRTPLTLTLGPLEDLKAELHGPLSADAQEELDLAIRNARRLLRLINQLLDISKLESGQMTMAARKTDLIAFLHDIAQAFAPWVERKQIAFFVELPESPVAIYADAEKLEDVFTNLLSNAFKFTPTGGSVRLRLQTANDHVQVDVKDNGTGIAPDEVEHIFERFYQVDESGFRLQPGTGIGLSLVKELVALHGGRIDVESEVGFGSTFTVTLPLGRDHLRAEDLAPDVEGAVPTLRRASQVVADLSSVHGAGLDERVDEVTEPEEDVTTVLVVEDNAEVRGFVARHLSDTYRVLEAADGVEGLSQAQTHLPDLILSDVMMPRMDGYALCRAIKEDPALAFIPVVLLTAKATTEGKIEGLEGGADDYLTKPFDAGELKARVRNLIVGRQRLKTHFSDNRGPKRDLHAGAIEVDATDEVFLREVRSVIMAHLAEEDFHVEQLAEAMGLSRSHLFRRLQSLLGQSPTDVLYGLRLERATQLLEGRAGSVGEVAYGVGFKSVSHFTKRFRARYGLTPTAYQARSNDKVGSG